MEKSEAKGRVADLSPAARPAQAAYLLRDYPAALESLEQPLRDDPELAGGQRLCGLALARLNREPEAIGRLREAVRHSSTDWLARAALASLLLRSLQPLQETQLSGEGSAVALLLGAISVAPNASRASLQELLGAAYWRAGQELLREGRSREAERHFGAAGAAFQAAADEAPGARRELLSRHSPVLVGRAVSLIVAGAPEAAQRLFSLNPLPNLPPDEPLFRFAAGLYELCEELALVPAEERALAVEALRQVVVQTRLEVAFYDGRGAVSLCWWGQPPMFGGARGD